MKKIRIILFSLCLLAFFQINAQQSSFGERELLIKFDNSMTEAEIDQYALDISATEVWVSPITQTRLWTVTDFTQIGIYYNNDPSSINDIIGTVLVQDDDEDIDESGVNFQTKIDPGTFGGNSGGSGSGGENENENALPSFGSICSAKRDEKSTNKNLKITIMDTGNNPLHSGIYPVSAKNYFNNSSNVTDPNGHGTAMTNLCKTSFLANSQFKSDDVDWDIRLTHDQNGTGSAANILLALEEAALAGSNIINMSFSFNSNNTYLHDIMQASIAAVEEMGIMVIASAGNDSNNNDNINDPRKAYPSSYDAYNILSVGSFNCYTNDISSFSSYGEYSVDILAPGTAIEGFQYQSPGTGQTVYTSGCSQATAITSGLALALGTMQSTWDYEEVKCAILKGRLWKNLSQTILSSGLINGRRAHAELARGCDDIIDEPSDISNPRSRAGEEIIVLESVFVYPNPAIDLVNINISNLPEVINVSILNITGQNIKTIYPKGEDVLEVNLSSFESGLYYVKINTQEKLTTASFIVE